MALLFVFALCCVRAARSDKLSDFNYNYFDSKTKAENSTHQSDCILIDLNKERVRVRGEI